jgi:hypothetical protein
MPHIGFDGRNLAIHTDRWRNLFNGEPVNFSEDDESLRLLDLLFSPVILRTATGWIVLEIQDELWDCGVETFPDESVFHEPVVSVEASHVQGLRSPVQFVEKIRQIRREGESWFQISDRFDREVQVWFTHGQSYYRGVDGRFYDTETGRLSSFVPTTQVGSMIVNEESGYLINTRQELKIIHVDRFGDVYTGYPESQVVSYTHLSNPQSLIPSNGSLNTIVHRNVYAENRLDFLIRLGLSMNQYQEEGIPIYLQFGENPILFHDGTFRNLRLEPILLRDTPMGRINCPVSVERSLVVFFDSSGQGTLACLENGRVKILSQVSVGTSMSGERRVVSAFELPRSLFPQLVNEDRTLYWDLHRRITQQEEPPSDGDSLNLQSNSPMIAASTEPEHRIPVSPTLEEAPRPSIGLPGPPGRDGHPGMPGPQGPPGECKCRPILEKVIANQYGLETDIPNFCQGYVRATVQEVQDLFQRDQIVRIEMNILLQPFAGPPGTKNRIALLSVSSGEKLFVRCQMDSEGNVFPPA